MESFEGCNSQVEEQIEQSPEIVQDHDLEHGENLEEAWVPKVGIVFDSEIEALHQYDSYAKKQGFGAIRKSSKNINGIKQNAVIGCNRSRKFKSRGSNPVKVAPTTKTNCPAKINIGLLPCGKWRLNSFVLDHNHDIDLVAAKHMKCNRILQPHAQREAELNREAGVRANKTVMSAAIVARGHENLTWNEKDVRNHLDKVRRHERWGGDANAMLRYLAKQQEDNHDFYYAIDVDEENRLTRVFWADARSREAYKWFGEVVTFDTTYLVNQFDMPFAPFVGVNHHHMTILFGCGLVTREDTASFVWLFEHWLACMSGRYPNAIITDQDKAMQKAIAHVFPHTRHRWCIWHIMKKIPEKLKGYKTSYEAISLNLRNVVYDSLTPEEFEENWDGFIEEYNLQDNEWLGGLYTERRRWVPSFVKNTFWAGMSSTQRSECMNSFFDGFLNPKTSLNEFVKQYENALRKKVMQEEEEDANNKNKQKGNLSPYGFENQFQHAFTVAIFNRFLNQVARLIGSKCTNGPVIDGITQCFIEKDSLIGDNKDIRKTVNFLVHFNEESRETYCNCLLFECEGIPCTHMISVWKNKKLDYVPEKYILPRWRKDVVRSHTKMKVSYNNWQLKPEWHRYDILKGLFDDSADLVIYSNADFLWMEEILKDIKEQAKARVLPQNQWVRNRSKSIVVQNDAATTLQEKSLNVGDPSKGVKRGRKQEKRKETVTAKKVRQLAKSYKKKQLIRGKENTPILTFNINNRIQDVVVDAGNMIATQDRLNFHTSNSSLQDSHMWTENWSLDLNLEPGDWRN